MASTPSTDGREKTLELLQDKDEPAAPPLPNSENSEVSHAARAAQENDQNLTPGHLPFSKARCIALVATLTGASFLNVSERDPNIPPRQHILHTLPPPPLLSNDRKVFLF